MFGGAAHLWDCIPSKTMIATGGAISFSRRIKGMGLEQADPLIDIEALTSRIHGIQGDLQEDIVELLQTFVKFEPAVAFQIQIGTPSAGADNGIVAKPISEPGLVGANLVFGQLSGRNLPVAAAKFAVQLARTIDDMNR